MKKEQPPEISGIHRNIMGTASFMGRFPGMRKAQDFIVYPIQDAMEEAKQFIKIQSETRIGRVNLFDGIGCISQSHQSGAYGVHLSTDKLTWFVLSREDCMNLKGWIKSTGGTLVGNNGVMFCENTGAIAL